MIKKIILSIICILMWIGLVFITTPYQKQHIELVNCYDRSGSLIINLKCERNVFDDKNIEQIYETGIGTLLGLLCIIVLLITIIKWFEFVYIRDD